MIMYFAILRFFENKGIIYFVKIVKISYHEYPPPITAPANKGQNLQVPSRPLSRGYTVFDFELFIMKKFCSSFVFYKNWLIL